MVSSRPFAQVVAAAGYLTPPAPGTRTETSKSRPASGRARQPLPCRRPPPEWLGDPVASGPGLIPPLQGRLHGAAGAPDPRRRKPRWTGIGRNRRALRKPASPAGFPPHRPTCARRPLRTPGSRRAARTSKARRCAGVRPLRSRRTQLRERPPGTILPALKLLPDGLVHDRFAISSATPADCTAAVQRRAVDRDQDLALASLAQGPRLEHARGGRPRLSNRPGRNETSTLHRRGGAARQASGGARCGRGRDPGRRLRWRVWTASMPASAAMGPAGLDARLTLVRNPRGHLVRVAAPPMRLSRRGGPSVPSSRRCRPTAFDSGRREPPRTTRPGPVPRVGGQPGRPCTLPWRRRVSHAVTL